MLNKRFSNYNFGGILNPLRVTISLFVFMLPENVTVAEEAFLMDVKRRPVLLKIEEIYPPLLINFLIFEELVIQGLCCLSVSRLSPIRTF